MQHPKEEEPQEAMLVWFLKLWESVEENYPKILAGIGAVVVAVLVAGFYQKYHSQSSDAAKQAMGNVYISLYSGKIDDALAESKQVLKNYSGQPVAREALMAQANLEYQQKDISTARTDFQKYLDQYGSDGPFGYGAWAGLASCLESEGKFADAAKKFAAYTDAHPDTPFASIALKEAGRCYEEAKDQDQAKAVYQRILDKYGDSPVANDAHGELSMMGVLVD